MQYDTSIHDIKKKLSAKNRTRQNAGSAMNGKQMDKHIKQTQKYMWITHSSKRENIYNECTLIAGSFGPTQKQTLHNQIPFIYSEQEISYLTATTFSQRPWWQIA